MLLAVPQAFRAWKRFAIWYVPLAAILFIIWPEPKGGMGVIPSVLGPSPEQAFFWISTLYVAVSGIIIFRAYFRQRH